MSTAPDLTREQWLAMRPKSIGSSEAAGALGLDPFTSQTKMWAQKRGLIEPDDLSANKNVRRGHRLQPYALQDFAEENGATLLDSFSQRATIEKILTSGGDCEVLGWVEGTEPFLRSKRYPWMTATLDGVAVVPDGSPVIVEAKAPGARQAAKWVEDSAALDHYKLQVQHALIVVPAFVQVGFLVALVGGSDYHQYRVDRSDVNENAIVTLERQFLDLVESGEQPAPDGSEATEETLSILHPEDNGNTIVLPPEAIEIAKELRLVTPARSAAEKREKELKTILKAMIGANTYGMLPDGSGMFSLKTQDRPEITTKATTYRVLREASAATTKRKKK